MSATKDLLNRQVGVSRPTYYECQDCGKAWTYDQLGDIHDLEARLEPGDPMPAGECPECGALCHDPLHPLNNMVPIDCIESLMTKLLDHRVSLTPFMEWAAAYNVNLDLQGADLRKAILNGVERLPTRDLQGAKLQCAQMSGAYLVLAKLQGANLEWADLEGADLRDADLRGANLTNIQLRNADLRGANLEGANLELARFANADLRGANLRNARIRSTAFIGANLEGANTEGADMDKAIL